MIEKDVKRKREIKKLQKGGRGVEKTRKGMENQRKIHTTITGDMTSK
jgi:hypothetical protein